MTVRAQVVRTHQFHLAHRGEDLSATQFPIAGTVAAGASQRPLARAGRLALQQFTQRYSPHLMHGRPQGDFYGFQIQLAVFVSVLPDHLQQMAYFARDFLLDGFGRFFSCGVQACSTGRNWQILSLTAISC